MLESIKLTNFRNYQTLKIEFEPGVNILVGSNGAGKTSVLEAVYYLALLRSFRTHQVRHLCRWQCTDFYVSGQASGAVRLATGTGERRTLRVNGGNVSRASDFIGHIHAVAYVPEDIELIKGPASERRRFLDIILSQLRPHYLRSLQEYTTALRSRNALLKHSSVNRQAVAAFDSILVSRGTVIFDERRRFFAAFKPCLERSVDALCATAKVTFSVRYRPSGLTGQETDSRRIEAAFRDSLAAGLNTDITRGHTQVGPHRDDFAVGLDGKSLADFGSEGQARVAALLLKTAASRMLGADGQQRQVILLVDDVVGELDTAGCRRFSQSLNEAAQAFVACTDLSALPELKTAAVFDVGEGTVKRRPDR